MPNPQREWVEQTWARLDQLRARIETERVKRLAVTQSPIGFSQSLGYTNKPFHNEWYHLLESGQSFLLEAPRSHAKSTVCAENYVLWRIVRDPSVRVIILSGVHSDALRLTFALQMHLKERFPWLVQGAPKWTETLGFYVNRPVISKDPTLRAASILGIDPGPRADLIICDDIVNEENSATQHQRDKVMTKLKKVVLPMLEPSTGQMVLDGTPYHYGDAYAMLKQEGWKNYTYTAILPDGTALWEERWPLTCHKDPHPGVCCLTWVHSTMGTPLFNCQMLCDPSGLVGRLLKLEWLEPYYDTPPGDLEVVQGVDLAISEKETADYTAVVTVGYSPSTRTVYVLDCFRGHLSFPEQIQAITRQATTFKPTRIIVEVNAYQRALYQALQGTMLPVIPRETIRDKVTRILAVSPYFETKRVLVRRNMHDWINEYVQFPDSEHDDLLDATELALRDIVERHWSDSLKYTPVALKGKVWKPKE